MDYLACEESIGVTPLVFLPLDPFLGVTANLIDCAGGDDLCKFVPVSLICQLDVCISKCSHSSKSRFSSGVHLPSLILCVFEMNMTLFHAES